MRARDLVVVAGPVLVGLTPWGRAAAAPAEVTVGNLVRHRTAAGDVRHIADPPAEAIVKQFPDRYRG